ncbi:hypothetical protein ACFSQD_00150 [Flavihumibacter stibioxidans]|uniref:Uncharacterized protein n=1 Tax=Flavihumibacter stibioxidans TaxID=1834163 RepID=A0ABR7MD57_9BACT|nr:hypothetical protein [Flavihumibacter stibioxidans]MBC6492911.1 hypothetical protein [Flavihumibacter stibioxidans]
MPQLRHISFFLVLFINFMMMLGHALIPARQAIARRHLSRNWRIRSASRRQKQSQQLVLSIQEYEKLNDRNAEIRWQNKLYDIETIIFTSDSVHLQMQYDEEETSVVLHFEKLRDTRQSDPAQTHGFAPFLNWLHQIIFQFFTYSHEIWSGMPGRGPFNLMSCPLHLGYDLTVEQPPE